MSNKEAEQEEMKEEVHEQEDEEKDESEENEKQDDEEWGKSTETLLKCVVGQATDTLENC